MSADADGLSELWARAIRDFEKETGPFLNKDMRGLSPDEILDATSETFKQFRGHGQRLLTTAKSCAETISLVASVLGHGLKLVYPPAEAITAAIVVLVKGANIVSANLDALQSILDEFSSCLDRIRHVAELDLTEDVKQHLVKMLVHMLSTLTLATKKIRAGRLKTFWKVVFHRDDELVKALKELDRLSRAESLAYTVAILTKMDRFELSPRKWLKFLDQIGTYEHVLRQKNEGTCKWLLEHDTYLSWKADETSSILWLHGMMGCGKTMLSTTVIESLSQHPSIAVTYYYFEFNRLETLSESSFLRALLGHLLRFVNIELPRKVINEMRLLAKQLLQPTVFQLRDILDQILCSRKSPLFVIIDGLDECILPERDYIVAFLHRVVSQRAPHLHVLVTSRDDPGIERFFTKYSNIVQDLPISIASVDRDIGIYVNAQLEKDKWLRCSPILRDDIRRGLIDKSHGMFRLVVAHFELLENAGTEEDVTNYLENLPPTLGEAYRRILIPLSKDPRTHTLFQIVSFAIRPMQLGQIACLLAVELGNRDDPDYRPTYSSKRTFWDLDRLVQLAGPMVTIGNAEAADRAKHTLRLAHASVKEYLLRYEAREEGKFWEKMSQEIACDTIARASLAYEIHLFSADFKLANDRFQRLMFGTTAQWPWTEYIQPPSRPQLLSLQHDFLSLWEKHAIGTQVVVSTHYQHVDPQLLFAAGLGLQEILEETLLRHDPTQGGILEAALQMACRSGKLPVVQYLLNRRPDVNANDGAALINAAGNGREQTVNLLLQNGADPRMNEQAALLAAVEANWIAVSFRLIDSGADVDADGGAALCLAAACGLRDLARVLVDERSAKVQATGGVALRNAAAVGDEFIVGFLLRNGADVHALDESALFAALAQDARHYVLRQRLFNYFWTHEESNCHEAGKSWVRVRSDNDASHDETALVRLTNYLEGGFDEAVARARTERMKVLQHLLDSGADISARGGRALQLAVEHDWLDAANLLLDHGAAPIPDGAIDASNTAWLQDAIESIKENWSALTP